MNEAISVVVPAWNEEHNVAKIYQALRDALRGETYELIFVDDGSTDSTPEQVRKLRATDPSVRLLRFGRNFGHQAALIAGIEEARGRAVITLDCDMQHPPSLAPKMLEAWRGGAKVVQMVRVRSEGSGLWKRTSSALFYSLINLLSEMPVTRGAADFQLLDAAVVESLLQFRDRKLFLRGLISWLGFPATRLEYSAPARTKGASGYSLRKMLSLSLHALTGLSSKPLRASFYLGLLTAIFCLLYSCFAIFALYDGKALPGWTSVIVAVTFLGAVQLISIGVLGEYIARIYEQARSTPRYVIVERDGFPPS